jgi:DHA2 family integral membrane protein (MFS transporter)
MAGIPGGLGALPPAVGAAVRDSIGSATVAAGSLPSGMGTAVVSAARQAFVSGMSTATLIAAAVVAVGTIVVALWLPGRSPAVDATTASLRALPAGEME